QCVLIGDVKNVVNQSEPVGRVEVFGEDGLQFIAAIAVAVAQQGQAVAALYIRTAFGLYAAGDHIFGFQLGRTAAPAFGNENVAVGEDQCLASDIEMGGDGGDRVALRHGRLLLAALCRLGDYHVRQLSAVRFGQCRIGAVLLHIRVGAATGNQQSR